jgi:Protein Family FAM117
MLRKPNESKLQPMKALIPVTSILRNGSISNAISPQGGHRSPGAMCYKGVHKAKVPPADMRRTASLDNLRAIVSDYGVTALLQLDKATQTDESCMDKSKTNAALAFDTPSDMKIEKVIRQRHFQSYDFGWQRTHREISSQTHSPLHSKASPVSIPPRCPPPNYMRPMRNSVEGLNSEIEKLVLYPGQPHTCRPETHMFSRGTPEQLFQDSTRSVNTQTPIMLSSDESPSTTPEEGTLTNSASPRINKFLAREPPDGCEKVSRGPF